MAELASLRQRPFLTLSFAKKLHQKTPYAAPATTPSPSWLDRGWGISVTDTLELTKEIKFPRIEISWNIKKYMDIFKRTVKLPWKRVPMP